MCKFLEQARLEQAEGNSDSDDERSQMREEEEQHQQQETEQTAAANEFLSQVGDISLVPRPFLFSIYARKAWSV